MSVTTTCRDVNELSNAARTACKLFFQECHKAGIHLFITETYRSQARQNYLYQQGRTRPGSVVTWTLKSRHKSRLAWDVGAATVNGNTNIYNSTIIKRAGAIAKKLNITWGGTWRTPDYPHFEVTNNWRIPKGYSLTPNLILPTRSNQTVRGIGNTPPPKPNTTTSTQSSGSGMGLVAYMNSLGMNSSFSSREKLAQSMGIRNYRGTAQQNTTIQRKLEQSKGSTSKPTQKPTPQQPKPVDTKERVKTMKLSGLSNNHLRLHFIGEIRKAVQDGTLNDPSWVERAVKGDIDAVEMAALHMLLDKSKRVSSNTSPTMLKQLQKDVLAAYNSGYLSDKKWYDDLVSGKMSLADVMLLINYINKPKTEDDYARMKKVLEARK